MTIWRGLSAAALAAGLAWAQRDLPSPNTVYLSILIALSALIGGNGLMRRGRRGKLLIFRFTPRGWRRLRLETTRSSRISSSTFLWNAFLR
jgi:hypothetical protein